MFPALAYRREQAALSHLENQFDKGPYRGMRVGNGDPNQEAQSIITRIDIPRDMLHDMLFLSSPSMDGEMPDLNMSQYSSLCYWCHSNIATISECWDQKMSNL